MEAKHKSNWLPELFVPGLVSVIVPTYNRTLLLQEALQSVLNQSYRPIECIVVDDGSTEDIKTAINKFIEEQDDNFIVKYIYQSNAGSQVARNTGTAVSKGEFVQYLDSDDLLDSNKLKSQVAFLQSNTNYDAVFGNWHAGDVLNNERVLAYANENLAEQMLTERCVANFSILMRRRLVDLIGPWDIAIKRNQEIDYHLRGLMQNASYGYEEIDTGLHRTHGEPRITNNTGIEEILHFYQKWERILIEHNRFSEEMKIKFAKLYMWFFTMDIKSNPTTIKLLQEAMRLDPNNSFFRSKKLKFMQKLVGTKIAIEIWLSWMIFYRKNQQAIISQ